MIGLVYTRYFAVQRRSFFLSVTYPGRGGFNLRCSSGDKPGFRHFCRFAAGRYFMLLLFFSRGDIERGSVF
ncbi:hypothetical protein [Paraburkholderia sp. J67]|uniref:hypothetical protein n=1 Tax=Paraburkholderia sp. J67 TaxID=2805435 RepID=UPI002ABE1EED|nr:hypothetical protein [Paraburkholderia sp. J67]